MAVLLFLPINVKHTPPTVVKFVVAFLRVFFDLLSVFSVAIITAYEAAEITKT